MGIFRSMAGMVAVELTSADVPGALEAITQANIPCYKTLQKDDLTVRFSIYRFHLKQLQKICEKRGESVRVLGRFGLYWIGKGLLKRPVLVAGIAALLALTVILPTQVFFVRVEGNGKIPTNRILAAAEESGICFGAARRDVRSERVKNALLEAVPELQWAGVNTAGCVATISVRERSAKEEEDTEDAAICSIVAARDGVVVSCTATRGSLLCVPGQAVTAGEVLISGYTDVGLAILAARAEGEVFAQTIRQFSAVTPSNWLQRVPQMDTKRKISLVLGKNRINLWKDSGISDTTCGRMYEEYYITLPGGFRLPFGIAVETYSICDLNTAAYSEGEARAQLEAFASACLGKQMVAGKILSAQTSLTTDGGCYRLGGEYVCIEMIGKMQREQIGENNGENS